jgi:hypothetical protein
MIKTNIINVNGRELVETSTTLPESKKLLQVETNIIYFDKVVDIPNRYTYREIDKTQEELEKDKELLEIKNKLMGGNK